MSGTVSLANNPSLGGSRTMQGCISVLNYTNYLLNTSAYTVDKSSCLRQEPESRTPILIMNGVNVETAQNAEKKPDFGPTLNN